MLLIRAAFKGGPADGRTKGMDIFDDPTADPPTEVYLWLSDAPRTSVLPVRNRLNLRWVKLDGSANPPAGAHRYILGERQLDGCYTYRYGGEVSAS